MPSNLLLPFQTCPGAVGLGADPEAARHVGALLLQAGNASIDQFLK